MIRTVAQSLASARVDALRRSPRECATDVWREICERQFLFRRRQEEIEELNSLTHQDLVNFYKDYIAYAGLKRRKLVISLGPDPILNTLDTDGLLMRLEDVPKMLHTRSHPFPTIPEDELDEWYAEVLACAGSEYAPPPPPSTAD